MTPFPTPSQSSAWHRDSLLHIFLILILCLSPQVNSKKYVFPFEEFDCTNHESTWTPAVYVHCTEGDNSSRLSCLYGGMTDSPSTLGECVVVESGAVSCYDCEGGEPKPLKRCCDVQKELKRYTRTQVIPAKSADYGIQYAVYSLQCPSNVKCETEGYPTCSGLKGTMPSALSYIFKYKATTCPPGA